MFSISALCCVKTTIRSSIVAALALEGVDPTSHGFGKAAEHGKLIVRRPTELHRHVFDLGPLPREDNHPVFDRGALTLEGIDPTSHGFGKAAEHGELTVRRATDLRRHVLDLGLLLA